MPLAACAIYPYNIVPHFQASKKSSLSAIVVYDMTWVYDMIPYLYVVQRYEILPLSIINLSYIVHKTCARITEWGGLFISIEHVYYIITSNFFPKFKIFFEKTSIFLDQVFFHGEITFFNVHVFEVSTFSAFFEIYLGWSNEHSYTEYSASRLVLTLATAL